MGLTADARGVQVPCGQCGQTNRLRYGAVERETRCGKCQAPLPAANAPVVVTSAEIFDAMLEGASLPIVVDFWAPWCGPCRAMAPEFEKVARNTAGRWLVVKVDTDAVAELGQRYRIMSIPTLAVFRGGREVARRSGAMPASDIEAFMGA
ncbi:MAG: thioredoxin TrxC [Vicinamibacterales bacterium]